MILKYLKCVHDLLKNKTNDDSISFTGVEGDRKYVVTIPNTDDTYNECVAIINNRNTSIQAFPDLPDATEMAAIMGRIFPD